VVKRGTWKNGNRTSLEIGIGKDQGNGKRGVSQSLPRKRAQQKKEKEGKGEEDGQASNHKTMTLRSKKKENRSMRSVKGDRGVKDKKTSYPKMGNDKGESPED